MDISLNFGSLDKMKTTSLETIFYLGISGKGSITSLGLKTIGKSKEIKKSRFSITNFILKDVSKIKKEFEDLLYESYVRKSSKNMPTYFSFYQESL